MPQEKYRVVAIILGGVIFSAPASTSALDNPTGPYLGVRGGLNLIEDLSLQDQYQPRVPISWEYERGHGIALLAGYKMTTNLRVEAEVGRAVNDVETFSVNGVAPRDKVADTTAYTYLFNAYYEFPLFEELPLIPYVGAGIGVSELAANSAVVSGGGVTVVLPDVSDWVFTYQFGIGASWEFEEYMAMDLGYRYLATENPRWGSLRGEYHSHSLLLGLRRHF